jgi:hypothetical protein
MSRELLKSQFKRLCLLKGAPQDPDAIRAWLDAADSILKVIGEQRFQATTERCIDTLQFFPMPATFREMIVSSARRDGTEHRRVLRKTCPECNRPPFGMIWGESVHPESGRHYQALTGCRHGQTISAQIVHCPIPAQG